MDYVRILRRLIKSSKPLECENAVWSLCAAASYLKPTSRMSVCCRGFFPVAVGFIRRIPILGSLLNLPGISGVSVTILNISNALEFQRDIYAFLNKNRNFSMLYTSCYTLGFCWPFIVLIITLCEIIYALLVHIKLYLYNMDLLLMDVWMQDTAFNNNNKKKKLELYNSKVKRSHNKVQRLCWIMCSNSPKK